MNSTVQALRRALPEETALAMVGYSMGGIIAMNYASVAGADSGVSCCVSMSGSFDTRYAGMVAASGGFRGASCLLVPLADVLSVRFSASVETSNLGAHGKVFRIFLCTSSTLSGLPTRRK